jgi:tetratricopeptide (TPR) repeat protein
MNKPIIAALLLSTFLTGCLAPQTKTLRAHRPALAAPVELKDVPFYPQEDHQCGPAALATMLTYAGKTTTPEQLAAQVYVPGRKGSFAIELAAAARTQGRVVYSLAPDLAAILAAVEQGYPVLVLQNNGLVVYPVWHFAVVVGADRRQEKIWLRSGKSKRLELSFSTFERTWARSHFWAVLVLDPARIPDTLDAPVVIRELALMEQSGAIRDAQIGFSRAVLNWPERKTTWLGLASTSLTLGDKTLAEATLRELVRREPVYGPGLNNLADFLRQEGKPQEALRYAQRAVSVLDIPETRATLNAIQQALSPYRLQESAEKAVVPDAALAPLPFSIPLKPLKPEAAPAP